VPATRLGSSQYRVMLSFGKKSWPVTVIPTLGPPAVGSSPIVALTGVGVGDGVGVGVGVGVGEGVGDGVGVGVDVSDGEGVGLDAAGLAATRANHRGIVASTLSIVIGATER
jgi:hypothetical protein